MPLPGYGVGRAAAKAYRPASYRQTRASAGCGLHGRRHRCLEAGIFGFAGSGLPRTVASVLPGRSRGLASSLTSADFVFQK